MRNLSLLLLVMLLVSCGGTNTPNPNDPNNPYAAFGCQEAPNTNVNQPSTQENIELGKVYERQGGAYRFTFKVSAARVRVTLTEIPAYSILQVYAGDVEKFGISFLDDARPVTGSGQPLTEIVLDATQPLEHLISIVVVRSLPESDLTTDAGKRLFCQRYKIKIETL